MAIKLDCPRCKKPLSVPRKKIGRYVNCPRCGGRFWVPENAADNAPEVDPDVLPSDTTAGSAPVAPAGQPPQPPEKLPATVSMGGAGTVPPGGVVPERSGGQNTPAAEDSGMRPPVEGRGPVWQVVPAAADAPSPTPAMPPPASGQKTARFVSAEAAQSPLKLAEDGRLPELHLREGEQKQKKEAKTTTVNPLVLFGLLAISAVLCAYLGLAEFGAPRSEKKDQARREIEERFFPPVGEEPLEYQEYLMQAQRANTRGDHEAERKMYEKVLDLLRQERPVYVEDHDKRWSLTTSPEYDEDLKDLISILLSSD